MTLKAARFRPADRVGEVCWLSAGEGAQGLYARLGFEAVGTQLNHGTAPP